MRILCLMVALMCACGLSAQAETETYLCIPDMATGFALDKASGKWHTAQFNVSGKKYLFKRVGKVATWNEFGSPFAPDQCSDFNEWGSAFCFSPFSTVAFNEKSLRYQFTYPGDYVIQGLSGPPNPFKDIWPVPTTDTPSIEIGTCSSLSG